MASPAEITEAAEAVARLLARRGGGLSPRDRRELALDHIAEELGVDDPAEQNAIYLAAEKLAAAAPRRAAPAADAGDRGPRTQGRRKARPSLNQDDIRAPFRFVSLNDKVALAGGEVLESGLDRPLAGGLCGRITVEWAAETPILIGTRGADDVDGPTRVGPDGPFVIPGATLRGLLRATCETVAFGRLSQLNAKHRYAVRDFTHPLFADENRTTWEDLGSGWLRQKPASAEERARGLSDYVLAPCEKRLIRIRALPAVCNGGRPTDNGEFHRGWLNSELAERYRRAGQVEGRAPDFERPERASRFTQDGEAYVRPDPDGSFRGYFVFAGKSPTLRDIDAATLDQQEREPRQGDQKKREYVFADAHGPETRLTQEQFDRFELAHTKPSGRAPEGSYAALAPILKDGRRIPVFHIGNPKTDAPTLSMGLTRLFKRSHRYSVGEVLAREPAHAPPGGRLPPDFVEALFGYLREAKGDAQASDAGDEEARKGRIATGFATLVEGAQARASAMALRTVMMGPRASYAPFYLRGSIKDWSDSKSRLAGRKRYFPRFPDAMATAPAHADATAAIIESLRPKSEASGEIHSRLRFLEPAPGGELVFRGDIRLHNVSAAELGALLWTITHGGDPAKPFRHMIGRAKNAGAGQVRVKSVVLELRGNDAEADALLRPAEPWELPADGKEGWTRPGSHGMAPFLRAFERLMQGHDSRWPNVPAVLELLGASDPHAGAALVQKGRAGYMDLPSFQRIRQTAKLDSRLDNPRDVPDRYLPADAVAASRLKRPYS